MEQSFSNINIQVKLITLALLNASVNQVFCFQFLGRRLVAKTKAIFWHFLTLFCAPSCQNPIVSSHLITSGLVRLCTLRARDLVLLRGTLKKTCPHLTCDNSLDAAGSAVALLGSTFQGGERRHEEEEGFLHLFCHSCLRSFLQRDTELLRLTRGHITL